MNNQTYHRIISIIEDIELTDKLLHNLKAIKEEPLNKIAFSEIERKKRNLIKKLLKEMINADLSFIQYENLYQKIFSYLAATEKETNLPKDWQKNINRAAQFLTIETLKPIS